MRLHIERARPEAEIRDAGSLDEALSLSRASAPDVLLLDYSMPGMNGVAGITRARAEFGAIPIVIMSGTAGGPEVAASIRAGANGFLPKSLGPEIFIQALNVVLAGGTYLPADIVASTMVAGGAASSPAATADAHVDTGLTPREMQVLQAIVNGKSNKEIGRELSLQEVTVKLHARRVYQKLGARNRAEVTAIAIERKIVQREVAAKLEG